MDDVNFDRLLEQLIASTRSPRGRFSAQASWPLLKQRLDATRKARKWRWLRPVSVAACIVLCLATGWMAWEAFKPVPRLTVSTLAEVRTIRLPDHTEVTLNRYSSLTYPERFKGKTREVQLQGEACFEVAKDARHPFIVQAQEVNVRVLGTHFNVEAYQPDASIKTTLLEGRVAVNIPRTGEEMVISPNESAIYDKEKGTLVREQTANAPHEVLWSKGILHFEQVSLQEIARQLSNAFHKRVYIEDTRLRLYRMTASFRHNESLEEILDLLKTAGGFDYRIEGDKISVYSLKRLPEP